MTDTGAPVLEYRQICHQFDGSDGITHSLQALDLRLTDAETICLIGPSGCGKTTALRIANRMLTATSGQVLFRNQDTFSYDPLQLRRLMGYVPQNAQLMPHMTVQQNIELLPRLNGQPPRQRADRAKQLLEMVNLPPDDFADRYPRTLSGGQQQRAAIARALALDPPCLLMDEPFSALDTLTRRQLAREFMQVRKLVAKAILLVTHDLDEAFLLGDRVALMVEGKVVQQGSREDFTQRPVDDFTREFISEYQL